ncbi:hypothetical protein OPIT5_06650 [Opitutaceae bacterium TAV5]|nr:hypothetical protein OPIT5_06650 [Opitutaceae bacterium TAV5]
MTAPFMQALHPPAPHAEKNTACARIFSQNPLAPA